MCHHQEALYVLYILEFSSNHFQIQIISPLYQGLDASQLWALCDFICGHWGAKCVFLVCTVNPEFSTDLFQIYTIHFLDQGLDANPCFSYVHSILFQIHTKYSLDQDLDSN